MLYERWQSIVAKRGSDRALYDLISGRSWTFSELDASLSTIRSQGDVLLAHGNTPEFILTTLAAWRDRVPLCPVDSGVPTLRSSIPSDVAHVKTTSASGGNAKMVLFSSEAIAADADQIVSTMGLSADSPTLGVISLAHSYGFSNLVTPLLLHGIPLMLVPSPLPELLRQAAASFPRCTLPAVPAMWNAWMNAGAIPKNLDLAISAGAPLPLQLEQSIYDECGLKVHNFYGSTECGGIAYDRTSHPRTEENHVGSPMFRVELSLGFDDCLRVTSPAVGSTYWPEPNANLMNGCFQTSDRAELSASGVRLLGRLSDVINVAGRKVAPESIEAILSQHPSVRECVVFGVPTPEDPSRGDQMVAIVSTTLDESELKRHLAERLPAWQIPRAWWINSALRANARGKISRADWRREWMSRTAST